MFLNTSNNSHNVSSESSEVNQSLYLNTNNQIVEDDDIDFGYLLRVLKRRSLIIISATITLTSLGVAWVLSKPPIFEGTVKMQVESVNAGSSGLGSLSGLASVAAPSVSSTLRSAGLDYASLTSILKSPFVMDSIVQDIQKKYPDIIYLPNPNQPEEEKEVLSKKLNVEQPGSTKMLEISYQSPSKEKILDILNEVVDGYLKFQEKESVQSPTQQLEFTRNQINRSRERVVNLETQVEEFLKKNNLISPESRALAISTQNSFLRQETQRILLELEGAKKLSAKLQEQLNISPEDGVIVARLNREPYYIKLLTQIKDLELKLATESIRLGSEHPSIEQLEKEKEELIVLLDQESQRILGMPYRNLSLDTFSSFSTTPTVTQQFFDVNNQIQVLEARKRGINEAQIALNQEISNLSTTSKEFVQLQRELRIATENLTRLLALRENLEIEVARQFSPWRLLTPIDESIIVESTGQTRKIVLIGIGSLLVGIVLGFFVDKLDPKLYNAMDVRKIVGLPILGTIPDNKKLFNLSPQKFAQKELLVLKGLFTDNSKAFNLDNYFSIYNNITALSPTRSIKSITMATVDANQGQSIISIYLAKAATLVGKKVLLVDMNLRQPKLHTYLGLENTKGISDVITEDISVNDAIQSSKLDNLFVLTAGSQIANPVGILSSNKMESVTQTLKDNFDFVIYNTPQLVEFSDAKIVTPLTEGLLFIIALGKTNNGNLEKVIGELEIAKLSVLGMIINGEG